MRRGTPGSSVPFWAPGGLLFAGVILAGSVLSACGSSGHSVKASAILTTDAPAKTVELLLESSPDGADGGFNFDGYGDGAMTVTVPLGWQVDVTCENASSTLSHSCAIVEDTPLSPFGAPLAFPGASTPNPKDGVLPGESAAFSFVATRTGTYRIACLVSGHEIDGMWDWFKVTRSGSPRVTT